MQSFGRVKNRYITIIHETSSNFDKMFCSGAYFTIIKKNFLIQEGEQTPY